MTTPRRPRRCGRCRMFGHDRRHCHYHPHLHGTPQQIYDWTMNNWRNHCYVNEQWSAHGGAGIDIPEPQPPKTPFELACENECKVTHTNECCICMETLGERNKITTACGHQFHFGCLVQDTNRSNKCPMCRAIIRPDIPKLPMILPNIETRQRLAERSIFSETFYDTIFNLLYVGNKGPTELECGIMKLTYDTILSNAETMLGGIRRTNA